MKTKLFTLIQAVAFLFFITQIVQCSDNKNQKESDSLEVADISPADEMEEEFGMADPVEEEVEILYEEDIVNVKELSKSDLPSEIKYTAEFKKAYSFKDKEGDKIIVLSEFSKPHPDNDYGGTVEMYAQLYTKSGSNYKRTWLMQDFVRDCELDQVTKFHDDFPLFTDLDNDGVYEVWIMYYLGCAGDLAPSSMKLLMYEGDKKHAIRGNEALVFTHDNSREGGDYTMDDAFKRAPESIKNYAKELWKDKGTTTINW